MGTKQDFSTKTHSSEIIRATRDEHNMSLRSMAQALEVSHAAVAAWESGQEPEQYRLWEWITDERRWVRRMGLEIFAARHMPIIENMLQPMKVARHA